jgi:dTMP kinase
MTHPARPLRGCLIAVEGLDGSGKSTFSRVLARAVAAEWDTTPDLATRALRAAIDEGWHDCPDARRLFYAASVIACGDRWQSHLARGGLLVVDRYWASTRAYADVEGGAACLDAIAPRVRPADLTLFLDAPAALRAARLRTRGASAADRDSLLHTHALESAYARALDDRNAGTVIRLDASLPLGRLVTLATRAITQRHPSRLRMRPIDRIAPHSRRRAVYA